MYGPPELPGPNLRLLHGVNEKLLTQHISEPSISCCMSATRAGARTWARLGLGLRVRARG